MAARWLRLSWHSSDSDSSTSPEDIGAVLVGNRKPAEERELSRLRAALHGERRPLQVRPEIEGRQRISRLLDVN